LSKLAQWALEVLLAQKAPLAQLERKVLLALTELEVVVADF
jgi:hypothetical protein